jgi:hypothetical protein
MWEIVVAGLKSSLPKAVDGTLRIVGAKLLGKALEWPEAWIDSHVQSKRDVTRARTLFSDGMATKALEVASMNDALVAAVVDDLIDTQITRTKNKGNIFRRTLEHIADTPEAEINRVAVPPDDWMSAFGRISEDISSDQMVETFARILAGEIRGPGSFSISTLRLISGMNQHVAAEFSEICKELIDDHIFKSRKYALGNDWLRIVMLRNEGLFSAIDSSVHQPADSSSWSYGVDSCFINIECTPGMKSEIRVFNLTAAGIEIAKLLPNPEYESSLRTMVLENDNKNGWKSVTLIKDGLLIEKLM